MHISLTPVLEGYVKEKVESQRYGNASEVIREALRLMQKVDDLELLKRQALRDAVWIGGEQALRGELSHRSVLDIIADNEASLSSQSNDG